MRFLRGRRDLGLCPEPDAHLRTAVSGPGPTTFVGVTDDPDRGIHPILGGRGLYEFWTSDDQHVWLHDMHFQGLTYSASPVPQIRFLFEWAEPPLPDGYAGPIVELTFDDVRVRDWIEEADYDSERDGCRDVTLFDYREDGMFWLATSSTFLAFAARTCRVVVRS